MPTDPAGTAALDAMNLAGVAGRHGHAASATSPEVVRVPGGFPAGLPLWPGGHRVGLPTSARLEFIRVYA